MYQDDLKKFINDLYDTLHLQYQAVSCELAQPHFDRILEAVKELQFRMDGLKK